MIQEAANEDDINYEVVKLKSVSVDLKFSPWSPFLVQRLLHAMKSFHHLRLVEVTVKKHCFVLPTASRAPSGLLGNLPEVNPDTTYFETWNSPGLSEILEFGFMFAEC